MNFDQLVPENIKKLNRYVAGKTIAEVQNQYRPKMIAKLASNENRLGCSPTIKKAVVDALQYIQDYPDPLASKLRKKIAELNGLKESEVLLAAGSESVLSILCRTFFMDSENAVTADATFVGFFVQTGVRGVELKKVPLTHSYKFDVDGILEAVDERTKMVYIANPNNPTGSYINRQEFSKLIEELPDHVLLITDEAYFEYAKKIEDYPPALEYRKDNVIILRTFSKAYGLAGFRIGYAIAHEDLIAEMIKTKLTFEPTATAQAAALAALDDQDFLQKSVEVVKLGKDRIHFFFEKHGIHYVPSISNSVMMILDSEEQAANFTQKMLEQGVILRQVGSFGLPNCVRVTIGTELEMKHFETSFLKIRDQIF